MEVFADVADAVVAKVVGLSVEAVQKDVYGKSAKVTVVEGADSSTFVRG